jgi:hypothetical protein
MGYRLRKGDLVKEVANNTAPLSTPEAASVSDTLGVAASLRLALARVPDGSRRVRFLPILCVRGCNLIVAPRFASPAIPPKRRCRRMLMGSAMGAEFSGYAVTNVASDLYSRSA